MRTSGNPALTRIRCEACGAQAAAYDLDPAGQPITHLAGVSFGHGGRPCPLPIRFCEATECPFGCGGHMLMFGRWPRWIYRVVGIRVKAGSAPCNEECVRARSTVCSCSCGGRNHGSEAGSL
jgi:hypothetical protein